MSKKDWIFSQYGFPLAPFKAPFYPTSMLIGQNASLYIANMKAMRTNINNKKEQVNLLCSVCSLSTEMIRPNLGDIELKDKVKHFEVVNMQHKICLKE